MDLGNEVVKGVLIELKSYAHVVLPTLLVYTIESRAHLKAWHAVRQLPHLEKEPSKDDIESSANFSETQIISIRAQHKAAKKIFTRRWISKLIFTLVLISVVVFEQCITIKGWLERLRDGEESDASGYPGGDDTSDANAEIQSGTGYKWYYKSTLGQIDWVKVYYPMVLFFPAVFLIARVLFLSTGLKDRLILRNSKGAPFVAFAKSDRLVLRRPTFTIVIASILLALGALVYRSCICSMILSASMTHFLISDTMTTKVSTKNFVYGGVMLLVIMVTSVWNWLTMSSLPIRVLQLTPHEGEINWSELIWSAFLSSGLFGYMSFFYRMDHAFARPEERLVGQPDTGVHVFVRSATGETVQTELRGTRIAFCPRRQSAPNSLPNDSTAFRNRFFNLRRCNRWPKPYFRTAVLSWIPVYTFIAYLNVKGYIVADAELTGVYALYLVPPVTCLAVVLRAAMKGRDELKRVWEYKEDWTKAEDPVIDVGIGATHEITDGVEIEGKVLISEEKN